MKGFWEGMSGMGEFGGILRRRRRRGFFGPLTKLPDEPKCGLA